MGKKKNINSTIEQSNSKDNKSVNNSLAKTYGIIGALILSYFLLTFSTSSVDKKMDKLSTNDTSIKSTTFVDENLFYLSANDNFIGLTRCSKLPLGRLSIKDSTHSSQDDVLTYAFTNDDKNTLLIYGKNYNYKKIVFTDVSNNNQSEITIDIPNDEYFLVSSPYSGKYENIRLFKNDDSIIQLN
ncbi:MAG: hypothetical protein ACRC7N_14460 [Clostridium sp.]